MSTKRRDNKGRILFPGEFQEENGVTITDIRMPWGNEKLYTAGETDRDRCSSLWM